MTYAALAAIVALGAWFIGVLCGAAVVEAAQYLVSQGVCHPSERYIRLAEAVFELGDLERALARTGAGGGSETT